MNLPIDKDNDRKSLTPLPEPQLPMLESYEWQPRREYSPGLRDFFEILLRRRWLILNFWFCVIAAVAVYNFTAKPIFKAVGTVEFSPDTPKITKFENIVADFSKDGGEYLHTQVELFESAALAKRVIDKLELAKQPAFNPFLDQQKGLFQTVTGKIGQMIGQVIGKISQLFSPNPPESEQAPDPALMQLRLQTVLENLFALNLQAEPRKDTNIVSVSFESEDPILASSIVNALIQEFINWQIDRRVKSTSTAKQYLDKRIDVARSELEESDSKLRNFSKETGIVSLDSKLNEVYQQLEKINDALAKAEADRITKKGYFDQLSSGDIQSTSVVLQNSLISGLKNQYIEMTAEYEKLRVEFKPDYPTVKSLGAKIANLGKRIEAEQQRILGSLKSEYLAAANTEKMLQSAADQKKSQALYVNDQASHYKILEREVEINKEIYQSLLQRSKEIDANIGTDLGNIKMVDLASIPLLPYKPNILRNMFLAVALGLFAALGLALFIEHLDDTIKRVDDLYDNYRLPVLGVIPLAEKKETKQLDSLVRLNQASAFSEAIRTTKASIQLESKENPVRTLLITSAAKSVGKSTIAANLAQAFASSEEKVLLIDVDLRRSRLHFSISANGNSRGLSHYLRGMCTMEEVIQKTDVPNLYFIAAGSVPHNPSELVSSNRMNQLIEALQGHFSRIILDGPPFGVFAEVLLLGHQVDSIVLVTALGQTQRDSINAFRKSFWNTNGKLVASIVNKLDTTQFRGGYYEESYRTYDSLVNPSND